MRDPSVQQLMKRLEGSGHESPYLDRLRARIPGGSSVADIELELRQEMAAALGRAEDKVNAALLRLELEAKAIDALVARGERTAQVLEELDRHLATFERLRGDVQKFRWELMVHREALGFRRGHDKLAELYPIPAARTRTTSR